MKDNLVAHFEAYSAWREKLVDRVDGMRHWLHEQELSDAQIDLRIQQILDRLKDDKLNVAFVAEFSRGKSELINSIFFAGYKQRLLPSSAGRTTMCPTELLYDETRAPGIMLLPIETRASDTSTTEYKRYADEWKTIALDIDSADSMSLALQQVSQVKRVPVAEAERYGLYHSDDKDNVLTVHEDGTVDVPAWRHAIINFPHPLLKQGLVILDTPGLNAIGTEPELTLNLLPNAHAILFILAADTGVTKSDIEVWRNHIGNTQGRQKGRIVVLNKIDGMWDDLKTWDRIQAEIDNQVQTTAQLLALEPSQVYPVSAQKGLLAKVNDDDALLDKSRLPALERALSDELIPSKQEIVRDHTNAELTEMFGATTTILRGRLSSAREQLDELKGLRGKNQDVIEHMMSKVQKDKQDFEKGLMRFQALRSVFSTHTNVLYSYLGMEALKKEIRSIREQMEQSKFTKGLRDAMNGFFRDINGNLSKATTQIDEIKLMMEAMYKKFSEEHGLKPAAATPFSTLKYQKELAKLEKAYNEHFNTLMLYANQRESVMRKFFETVATRMVQVHEIANRDIDNWLKAIMAPMETQVREHQLQLRRRLESIKRIHKATDTLEDRVAELEHLEAGILRQLDELNTLSNNMQSVLLEDANRELAVA
jgi:hypothetical protein